MLYSSGTTGRPKGVAFVYKPEPLGTPPSLLMLAQFVFGFNESTRYLSPAPLYHAAPLRFNMAVHRLGGTTVVMEHFDAEEYLAAGPNNPVGVTWINLAKSKSTEPLPYGLHGTSIPNRMRTQQGIGGLRLANWDIVRAVQLLPAGTPLQWK